eukprot:TRINITY_DN2989_c0_g1_i1.p1 TRINITY_DN2989_c0_g1~~TRINITY_DN2989_c0_g1_i1.p1  ORF type:complete len:351 (+),score=72.75 TRINITY_DN2989_c0_g1_i1:130-1182(+)
MCERNDTSPRESEDATVDPLVLQFPSTPSSSLGEDPEDDNTTTTTSSSNSTSRLPLGNTDDTATVDRSLSDAILALREPLPTGIGLDPDEAVEQFIEETLLSQIKTFMSGTDLTETYIRNLTHGDFPIVSLDSIKKWSQTGQFYKKFPQMLLLERMREMLSITEIDIPKGGFPTRCEVDNEINERVSLWSGDITTLQVDAIVNSAHPNLTGGGGVDGYIHARAGDALLDECLTLSKSLPGEAKITKGYQLPASRIIHTVGPTDKNAFVLEACYVESLDLLVANNLRSIAFPCIATGHYDYPIVEATEIALKTVRAWLEEHKHQVDRIIFCTFKVRDEAVYEAIMPSYFPV